MFGAGAGVDQECDKGLILQPLKLLTENIPGGRRCWLIGGQAEGVVAGAVLEP